jgi:hypothetical protein
MDHKICRAFVPKVSDQIDSETLRLLGKYFKEEFFSNLPDEWKRFKISHILEKHGQNETVAVSTLESTSIKTYSKHLKDRFGWASIKKFSFAWTLEVLPRNHNNNSYFISKEGTHIFLIYIKAATLIMKDPKAYPKAGIQEICNYQSDEPFVNIPESFFTFSPDIQINGANCQIYCGTRHFLRKTASEEPFYHGKTTNYLSEYDFKVDNSVIISEILKARELINVLKNATGSLRIEQNLDYTISKSPHDICDFFYKHLEQLIRYLSISSNEIFREEFDIHRLKLASLKPRCGRNFFGAALDYYERHNQDSFECWTLCGIPVVYLQLQVIPYHIWPGLILAYLNIFEEMVNQAVSRKRLLGFIPTVNLEVICLFERFLQYCFSGNGMKIGRDSPLACVFFDNLVTRSFPYLSPLYFRHKGVWEIVYEAYPTEKMFCFSSFLGYSKFRAYFFVLETFSFADLSSFADALIESIKRILQALFEKDLNAKTLISLTSMFSNATWGEMRTKNVQIGCDISLKDWLKGLLTLFLPGTNVARIKPLSLRFLCNLMKNRSDDYVKNNITFLLNRLTRYFHNSNMKWLPMISDSGISHAIICSLTISDDFFKLLDFSACGIEFYQNVFIPRLFNAFKQTKVYLNNSERISEISERAVFCCNLLQDRFFKLYFFKMLFFSGSLIRRRYNNIQKLVMIYSTKLIPLIILYYGLCSSESNIVDLFKRTKKRKHHDPEPFKDLISIKTLVDLDLYSGGSSWISLRRNENYAKELDKIEIYFDGCEYENVLKMLTLENYEHDNRLKDTLLAVFKHLRN